MHFKIIEMDCIHSLFRMKYLHPTKPFLLVRYNLSLKPKYCKLINGPIQKLFKSYISGAGHGRQNTFLRWRWVLGSPNAEEEDKITPWNPRVMWVFFSKSKELILLSVIVILEISITLFSLAKYLENVCKVSMPTRKNMYLIKKVDISTITYYRVHIVECYDICVI